MFVFGWMQNIGNETNSAETYLKYLTFASQRQESFDRLHAMRFFPNESLSSIQVKASWKILPDMQKQWEPTPLLKYAPQIGSFPQFLGWTFKKYLKFHYPENIHQRSVNILQPTRGFHDFIPSVPTNPPFHVSNPAHARAWPNSAHWSRVKLSSWDPPFVGIETLGKVFGEYWEGYVWFLSFVLNKKVPWNRFNSTQTLNVWYIFLHLPQIWAKCR